MTVIGGVYSGLANRKSSSYYSSLSSDVQKYYSDYLKNTSLKASQIKYPYKSGYMDYQKYANMSDIYNATAISDFESSVTSSMKSLAKIYGAI